MNLYRRVPDNAGRRCLTRLVLLLVLCALLCSASQFALATFPSTTDTDVVLWLDASSGVTRNGNNVTAWTDKSATHRTITVTGSPQYIASGIGSQPTMSFNGSCYFTASACALPAFTIFTVINTTDTTGSFIYGPGGNTGGSSDYSCLRTVDKGSGTSAQFYIARMLQSPPILHTLTAKLPAGTALNTGQALLTNESYNGTCASLSFRLNEAAVTLTQGTGSQDPGTYEKYANTTTIGGGCTGMITPSYIGQLAEIIIYKRALTSTEYQQVEQYLWNKYFCFTVTPSAGANGTITPNTPQAVTTGGNITLTATPNTGYATEYWYVDGSQTPAQTGGTTFTLSNVTAAHSVNVTFDAVPTVSSFNAGVVNSGATTPITLQGSDTDAAQKNQTLSYTCASQPAHGAVTIAGNQANYTPATGYTGTDSFTYTVSDGIATSAAATVTVTVNGSPTITAIASQSCYQGDTLAPLSCTVHDDLTAAGSLTVTAASDNITLLTVAGISIAGPNGAGQCTVTLTPQAGQSGTATVTLTVTDGNTLSTATSFSLTVNAPPVTTLTAPTANQTTVLHLTDFPYTLQATVSSPTNVPISQVVFSVNSVQVGQPVITTPYTCSWTTTTPGSYTITAVATDTNGKQGAACTATIIVGAVDLELANLDPSQKVTPGGLSIVDCAAGALSATATLSSLSAGDLTLSWNPALLFIYESDPTVANSGSITWPAITGSVSKSLQVVGLAAGTAGITLSYTNTADNTITFTDLLNMRVDGQPIPQCDSYGTTKNQPVSFQLVATDADPNAQLTFQVTGATNGAVTTPDAQHNVTYTPNTDYVGSDLITFTVTDAYGASATGVISIIVSEP